MKNHIKTPVSLARLSKEQLIAKLKIVEIQLENLAETARQEASGARYAMMATTALIHIKKHPKE